MAALLKREDRQLERDDTATLRGRAQLLMRNHPSARGDLKRVARGDGGECAVGGDIHDTKCVW